MEPATLLGTGDVSSWLWAPSALGRECPCPEGPRDSVRAAQTWSRETQTPVWTLPLTHSLCGKSLPPSLSLSFPLLSNGRIGRGSV